LISNERIERAAIALWLDEVVKTPVRRVPENWPDESDGTRSRWRKLACVALNADAPALLAAKIDGMREAVAFIRNKCKAFGDEPTAAWPLIELTGEVAARIAELQAKMEKALVDRIADQIADALRDTARILGDGNKFTVRATEIISILADRDALKARVEELEKALNTACQRGCNHCADDIRRAHSALSHKDAAPTTVTRIEADER